MASDPLLEPSSQSSGWYQEVRAPGAVAQGSGRLRGYYAPGEQAGPPESKPQAAQLGWAGGQMDRSAVGRLGPPGSVLPWGPGAAAPPLWAGEQVAGRCAGWGRGRKGPARVGTSSLAAPPSSSS